MKKEISITNLLINFRNSLNSLLPHLREVYIPAGYPPGAYGWDDISEALFVHLVIEPIRYSLPISDEEKELFQLPQYETDYKDYSTLSLIRVLPVKLSTNEHEIFVFRNFELNNQKLTFSKINCVAVDATHKVTSRKPTFFDLEEAAFSCLFRSKDSLVTLESINISSFE